MAATTVGAVPSAARSVRDDWHHLSGDTVDPPSFGPEMVVGLPVPARRWLTHAIPPGTPLYRAAEVTMRGEIRLGAAAVHRAAGPSPSGRLHLAATAHVAGMPVKGYDRYSSGTGQLRWRLLGLIPVMTATGADVARSAAGRLAAGAIWIPTSFRTAELTAGSDRNLATGTWHIGDAAEVVHLHVGDSGQLTGVHAQWWGNPSGAPFQRYPFGATIKEERTFGGVTIPSVLRAGWWWGTDRQDEGEFFRAQVTGARFH